MQTPGQKRPAVGAIITLNEKAREWTSGRKFIVEEVRPWGVICYYTGEVTAPSIDPHPGDNVVSVVDSGRAYYRATFAEIDQIEVSPAQ